MTSLERKSLAEWQNERCWICLETKPESQRKHKKGKQWLKCKCSFTAHEACLKHYVFTAIKQGRARNLHPFFMTRQFLSGSLPLEDVQLIDEFEKVARRINSPSNKAVVHYLSQIDEYFLNHFQDEKKESLVLFRNTCKNYWQPGFWVNTAYYYVKCPQCTTPIIMKCSLWRQEAAGMLVDVCNTGVCAGIAVVGAVYSSKAVVLKALELVATYGQFCMHTLIPDSVRKARLKAYRDVLSENDNSIFQRADYLMFAVSSLIAVSLDWDISFSEPLWNKVYRVRQSDFWICLTETSLYFLVAHSSDRYRFLSYNSIAYMIERLLRCLCFNPIHKSLITSTGYDIFNNEESTAELPENASHFAKIKAFCRKSAAKICEFLTTNYVPETQNFFAGFVFELLLWPSIGCLINRNIFMRSGHVKAFLNKFSDTPDEAIFLGNMIGASAYRIGKQLLLCTWRYYECNYIQKSQIATYSSSNMLALETEGYAQLFAFATALPKSEYSFPLTPFFTKYFLSDSQRRSFPTNPSYTTFREKMRTSTIQNFSCAINSVE